MIQNLSFALGLAQVWTLFLTKALDKAIEFELVLVEGEHITDFETSPISERWRVVNWGRILYDFDLKLSFLLLSWGLVVPGRPVLDIAYNKKYIIKHFRTIAAVSIIGIQRNHPPIWIRIKGYLWRRYFDCNLIPRQRLRGGRISERRVFEEKEEKDDQYITLNQLGQGRF